MSARPWLALLTVTLLASACSSPTLAPLSADNVAERIALALARDGHVLTYAIQERDANGNDRGRPETGWLDLPNARSRHDVLLGDFSVAITSDGVSAIATLGSGNARIRESPAATADQIESPLQAAQFFAPFPLGPALNSREPWTFAGDGEWDGGPASVWETMHLQRGQRPEWRAFETLYLDPATDLPLGQRTILRDPTSSEPIQELQFSFTFEFVASVGLDPTLFSLDAQRLRVLGAGGSPGQPPMHDVYWFGGRIPAGESASELFLRQIEVIDRPSNEHVEFTYDNGGRPIALDSAGGTLILYVGTQKWWEYTLFDPETHWTTTAERTSVEIDGTPAEYAIADNGSTEMVVWFPDAVALFIAPRVADLSGVAGNAYDDPRVIERFLPLLRQAP